MYLRVYRNRFDEEISVVVEAIKELLAHQTKAKSLVWQAINTGETPEYETDDNPMTGVVEQSTVVPN